METGRCVVENNSKWGGGENRMGIELIAVLTAMGLCWFATTELERIKQENDDTLENLPLPEELSSLEKLLIRPAKKVKYYIGEPPVLVHSYPPVDSPEGNKRNLDEILNPPAKDPAIKWIKRSVEEIESSLPAVKRGTENDE